MRFYTQQHQFYYGIDLHARTMSVCIMDNERKVLTHKNMAATAEDLIGVIEPYRSDVVLAVECIFTWYWIADLCSQIGVKFVLGHALYMKAIHGGKVKNDKIDSQKIAAMLRGGMLPMAYVYIRKECALPGIYFAAGCTWLVRRQSFRRISGTPTPSTICRPSKSASITGPTAAVLEHVSPIPGLHQCRGGCSAHGCPSRANPLYRTADQRPGS